MLKTTSFIFFFLVLISCGKSGGHSGTTPGSTGLTSTDSQLTTDSPVPSDALNFQVDVKLDNFNSVQEDKVLQAADLIEKVVVSEEFKNAVLNHTYNGKKTFVDNGGMSNAQIYQTIIDGSEKLHSGKDHKMDLEIEVFARNDSTVGYTLPNVIKIWMNSKYLNQNSPVTVTANMMHEWLHKLGFDHAYQRTPSRPFSVPYAIGYMVADLAQKM